MENLLRVSLATDLLLFRPWDVIIQDRVVLKPPLTKRYFILTIVTFGCPLLQLCVCGSQL